MRQLVYDPQKSGETMNIVCFISGSGTNYREIAARNPRHRYLVFTNRPGCRGEELARNNKHPIIELSHIPYLQAARQKYGPGNVPRNCPERLAYDQEAVRLIESRLGARPDLICLAGYDLLTTDWMVDRYYPRILNVHPGDNTKGYSGLHWIPAAKAILAGEEALRSTLFIVDKGLDTGPVLVQSAPLNILQALQGLESAGKAGLTESYSRVIDFSREHHIRTYTDFKQLAGEEKLGILEIICSSLQQELKVCGDWAIYPFGVHDLIAAGRVATDERQVYLDGRLLPIYGYRLDCQR
jgi:folate-dependent phosphoribosylglycinamide formyltransferase PurN